MKNNDSNGYRLFSFRAGDRSEYLAVYALTQVAFVTPVPRQEDFGIVDFHCVLTRKEGKAVIPACAFNVQVKSGVSKLQLNSKKIKWMSTNMDSPLFLCAVDKINAKRHEPRIRLYSCLNIWSAFFYRMEPQNITLHPGKEGPNGAPCVHHPGNTGDKAFDQEGRFDVFLGPPVIDMLLNEFEQKSEVVFDVMSRWIRLDRINVALMRLGRTATFDLQVTASNELPTAAKVTNVFSRSNVNQHGLLDKIWPLLESLRRSYWRIEKAGRAAQVRALIDSFDDDTTERQRTALARDGGGVSQSGLRDELRPLLESLRELYGRIENFGRVGQIQALIDVFASDANDSQGIARECHDLRAKVRPLLESLQQSYQSTKDSERFRQIQMLLESIELDAADLSRTPLDRLLAQ